MTIQDITPQSNYTVRIVAHDGRVGVFDVSPYLHYEAFAELQNQEAFMRISNGGYFIEWACGADLSADTIEAQWRELPADTVHTPRSVLA
jgi:hypothetical protein